MTMLDSYCPSIRKDLEGIYQPREETNESSVSGEVMAEMAPIEDAADVVVGEENKESEVGENKESGVGENKESGVEKNKES